jgi:hypothetical protein
VVVTAGTQQGKRCEVRDNLVVGRGSDVDLQLDDPEVSRKHVAVRRAPVGYVIEDLASRNRTLVNGAPLDGPRALAFGDRVQLGPHTVLLFLNEGAERDLLRNQRLEALGRMGAGVAHDINNMLAVMLSSLDFFEQATAGGTCDPAAIRECLDDARTALGQAAGLTPRLVAFGREGREEEVDVSALCHEITQLARRTFQRSIEIEHHISPSLRLRGDRVGLHQVLMNLCLNARDAMPRGGRLCVRASACKHRIVLSVSDTGVGLNDSARARIFDPFFTTKASTGGCGLGLATVREVVTAHGGSIDVESAPGGGTTFRVTMPGRLLRDPALASHDDEPRSAAPARRGSILIVDDELTVRRAFARLLRVAGHSVTLAADGNAALQLVQSGSLRPDLVLLDLDMPGLRGDEVQRRLLELQPTLRIVFASGHISPDVERAVLEAGAVAFLGKPVASQLLLATVDDALGRDD